MSANFLEGMSTFFKREDNDSLPMMYECQSAIDHYNFYQLCLIPAVLLTLIMASTTKRRRKLLNFLNGRPGLIFPMDTLTRSSRISYCCAFGATGFLVYQIILEKQFAIDYTGPAFLKPLIAIVSMFIYGLVIFPAFASLALDTAFSYGLGTLYVWMFFIVNLYELNECQYNLYGRAILLIRALPSTLCLGYLCISLPARFVIACHRRNLIEPHLGESLYRETLDEIKQSYQGQHVRKLLCKPKAEDPSYGTWNKLKASVVDIFNKWVYRRQKGFRYPSRLMSMMFVAAGVVYVITVETLVFYVIKVDRLLEILEIAMKQTTGYYFYFNYIAHHIISLSRIAIILSITLACFMSFMTILHMMSSFRTNLLALYRGDHSHIPPADKTNAALLCVASIKFGGFQVAYIVWGYVISAITFFILIMMLCIFIKFYESGIEEWFIEKLQQFWPSLLITMALLIAQKNTAKYFFLQDRGQHLRLDNRHLYFVFSYFMFFYNIFLGFFSCLLRIIKAITVGIFILARLDNSTLPRKFEFFDPGFKAYIGYIHMEVAHTHPVVIVFIRLLVLLVQERKNQESGQVAVEMAPIVDGHQNNGSSQHDEVKVGASNVSARFNWLLVYTLINNPSVRIYRKGFIQAMKKARKEGIRIPVSDQPITDFDLVKALQQKEKEREEMTCQSSSLSHAFAKLSSTIKGTNKDVEVTEKRTKKIYIRPRWLSQFKLFKKKKRAANSENISKKDGCYEEEKEEIEELVETKGLYRESLD